MKGQGALRADGRTLLPDFSKRGTHDAWVATMIKFILDLIRANKMNRAMNAAGDASRCTACESTEVMQLAAAAYRCLSCGYEGGDGYAAYKTQQRAAKFAELPEEERRGQAKRKLENARHLLLSGIGDANHALTASALDIVGVGSMAYGGSSGEGNEKHNMLTAAVGMLLEAKNEMVDSQMLLGRPLFGGLLDGDMGGMGGGLAAADLHLDNLFTDLLAHGKIQEVLKRAQTMKSAVEQVLSSEFQ